MTPVIPTARTAFVSLAFLFATSGLRATAQEYSIEPLNEPPPKAEIAPSIYETLSARGFRVKKGTRTHCEFWFCRDIEMEPIEPTNERRYGFKLGQLLGVARYARKGADFRDQEIEKGIYTLRFWLQPRDGAHEGTSITRDFLMIVKAKDDKKLQAPEYGDLTLISSDAVMTSHPGILALKAPPAGVKTPSLSHQQDEDWWLASLSVAGKVKGKPQPITLTLVVVGAADE